MFCNCGCEKYKVIGEGEYACTYKWKNVFRLCKADFCNTFLIFKIVHSFGKSDLQTI